MPNCNETLLICCRSISNVAAEYTVSNAGTKAFDATEFLDDTDIKDTSNKTYQSTVAVEANECSSFNASDLNNLTPKKPVSGCIVYEVPASVTLAVKTFLPLSGTSYANVVDWTLN